MSDQTCSTLSWSTPTTHTCRQADRPRSSSNPRMPPITPRCDSSPPTSSTFGFRPTTTRTSSRARSCGGFGRLSPPPAHQLDDQRRDRHVNKTVEHIDHVVLAEVDDAEGDSKSPRNEAHRKPSIPPPRVDGGQRRKRRMEGRESRELVGVEVGVKRRDPVVRSP